MSVSTPSPKTEIDIPDAPRKKRSASSKRKVDIENSSAKRNIFPEAEPLQEIDTAAFARPPKFKCKQEDKKTQTLGFSPYRYNEPVQVTNARKAMRYVEEMKMQAYTTGLKFTPGSEASNLGYRVGQRIDAELMNVYTPCQVIIDIVTQQCNFITATRMKDPAKLTAYKEQSAPLWQDQLDAFVAARTKAQQLIAPLHLEIDQFAASQDGETQTKLNKLKALVKSDLSVFDDAGFTG